ncbi:MAG: tripartite tricarboxylate transporter TctB family protein [Proteobacteria bacterium]|nr:tripartite tricarboxylate transporter TctB family protein [Pseudomonadota bacterium]
MSRNGATMNAHPRVNQDVLAGLLFAAFGAAGLWFGWNYPLGSVLRMGPGYVPMALSWGLVALGGVIVLRGIFAGGAGLERWRARPLALVCAALIAFAVLLESTGLVAASVALVLVSALAGPQWRWREAAMLAVGLAIAAVALFVYGLRLPMPVWPF